MLNLKTNVRLRLDENVIVNKNYSKELKWNLSKLVSIITLDSIEDDAKVQAILAESRKGNYMGQGAIIGGLIDSVVGNGDSILDGVIVGALFGSLINKNVSTKEPVAGISLLFSDGVVLPLEVNKYEYVMLQNKVVYNHNNDIDCDGLTSSFSVLYRIKEFQSPNVDGNFLTINVGLLFIMFISYYFIPDSVLHSEEYYSLVIRVFLWVGFLIFGGLAIVTMGSIMLSFLDSLFMGGYYRWSDKQYTQEEFDLINTNDDAMPGKVSQNN